VKMRARQSCEDEDMRARDWEAREDEKQYEV
jgi:hypothetical protein